jgi:hypothetical protein
VKIVYSVVERDGKQFWCRIGEALVEPDGALRVKLDSLPVGELAFRDPPEKGAPS